MANTLIASLGESPGVVTALVDALREHPDGPKAHITRLVIVHPNLSGDTYVGLALDAVRDHLPSDCACANYPMSYPDVDSEGACLDYLHTLDRALQDHQQDTIYVSLAGGRKSMSAVKALMTQFHRTAGIYHLLDRHEDDRESAIALTIDDLYDLPEAERRRRMRPPLAHVSLIRLGGQSEPLASAQLLRRLVQNAGERNDVSIRTCLPCVQFSAGGASQ